MAEKSDFVYSHNIYDNTIKVIIDLYSDKQYLNSHFYMCTPANRYFIINKPLDMVSQFVSSHKVRLLGDLNYDFPAGTHAIGRLDKNSEGLLILTTNKEVTRKLFQSETPHKRTYIVQVKNAIQEDTLNQLRTGVSIKIKGGIQYVTPACEVSLVKDNNLLKNYLQDNKNIPSTWLSITLTEGKYHQVRKMVAAVHHRCKRLVRVSIDNIELGDLAPGGVIEIEAQEFFIKTGITL